MLDFLVALTYRFPRCSRSVAEPSLSRVAREEQDKDKDKDKDKDEKPFWDWD